MNIFLLLYSLLPLASAAPLLFRMRDLSFGLQRMGELVARSVVPVTIQTWEKLYIYLHIRVINTTNVCPKQVPMIMQCPKLRYFSNVTT